MVQENGNVQKNDSVIPRNLSTREGQVLSTQGLNLEIIAEKLKKGKENVTSTITVENLIVLKGIIAGQEVRILKNSGSNTNVISSDVTRKHKHFFIVIRETKVSHSSKEVVEKTSKLIRNATI